MFKPCANDEEGESEEKEAPHGTGPEELELKATIVSGTMKGYCLEAPSKTSRNPRLKARHLPPAKEIFTSSANQGTRAQLKSSMVNAGWRYVEPAFKASPYNLALDLREHLGLMCGKTLLLDTHPLRPVRRSGMKECKLVIRRNPQAAMTKESLDKESGTPEQTRRWEKFIIGKGTQNLTFTVATTKQKSVKNFNTPTLRVDPYNKSWEKSQDGLYVAEAGLVIPLDLTQAALAGLDALETLTITVTHTAPKTDYVIDVNRSVPARSFTARLVKAPFLSAWDDDKGIGFRTYATLPLGLTLMRSPSTGRDATKSEQVRAVEEASFAVGVVGALELWNYHKNEPVVPILNPMVQLGVLTSAPTDFSIWDGFSFVAGFAFRSPVTTTTDTVVETELSFNIWYELLVAPKGTDVIGHWFVHHGVLFGFSAEIGTLFE